MTDAPALSVTATCEGEQLEAVVLVPGGACCLEFISRYPGRVSSLALIEPAWIGKAELMPEEQEYWAESYRVMALPAQERMAAFVRANSREGSPHRAEPERFARALRNLWAAERSATRRSARSTAS